MTPATIFKYAFISCLGLWTLILLSYMVAIWTESGKLAATASVLLAPAIIGSIITGIYYEDKVS